MSIHIVHSTSTESVSTESGLSTILTGIDFRSLDLIVCFDQESLTRLQSALQSTSLKEHLHIGGIKSDADIAYEMKKGRKRVKPDVGKGSEISALEHYTITYHKLDQFAAKETSEDETQEKDDELTEGRNQKLVSFNDECNFDLTQMRQLPIFKKQVVETILPTISIQSHILMIYSHPEKEVLVNVLSVILLLSFNELCYNSEISARDYELTSESQGNHIYRLEYDYNGDGNRAIHSTSDELLIGDHLENKISEMLFNLISRLDWTEKLSEVNQFIEVCLSSQARTYLFLVSIFIEHSIIYSKISICITERT